MLTSVQRKRIAAAAASFGIEATAAGELVAELSDACPGACVSLQVLANPVGQRSMPVTAITRGIDPALIDAYLAYYGAINPYNNIYVRLTTEPALARRMVAPDVMLRSEFYQDWARHSKVIGAGAGVALWQRGTPRVALAVNYGLDADEARDNLALEALKLVTQYCTPNLDIAMLDVPLQSIATSFLDVLRHPAFVIMGGRQLVHANGAGQNLLSAAAVAALRGGRFCFIDPALDTALEAAFNSWVTGQPMAGPLVVRRPSGSPILFRLLPFIGADAAGQGAGAVDRALNLKQMLVVAIDPDDTALPPPDLLASIYGLTKAEAAVALAIAGGRSLEEYASEAKVSPLTARNQLRSASEKMGAPRQAQVVTKVMRLGLVSAKLV